MAWGQGIKGVITLAKKYGPDVIKELKKAGHITADMAKEASRVIAKDAKSVGKAAQKSKTAGAIKKSATGKAATKAAGKAANVVKKSKIIKKATQVEHDIEKAAGAAKKAWRGTKTGKAKPKVKTTPKTKPSRKTAAEQAKELQEETAKHTSKRWRFAKGGIVKTNSNKADGWL